MRHPKPTPEMNAGRAVRRATVVIKDKGWIQGSYGYSTKGFCIVGAIRQAIPDHCHQLRVDAIRLFGNWLDGITSEHGSIGSMPVPFKVSMETPLYSTIPAWNDAKGRTEEEVLLHMNKFADEMDPQ